jgi:drug/metabolite transporter (DMT)-like permease
VHAHDAGSAPAGPAARAAARELHQPSGRAALGFALALATMLLWAGLPLALQLVLRRLDALTLTAFRFAVAAAVLGALLARGGRLPALRRLSRNGSLLLIGATVGLATNYISFLVGLDWTGEATSQVVIQLAPLLLSAGGVAVFGERFTPAQWLGFGAMAGGLVLFSAGRISGFESPPARYLAGTGLIVFAAVTWAAYGLAQKQLLRHLPPQGVMLCVYAGCTLCFAPFASPAALAALDLGTFALLVACAANTLLAYGAFVAALAHWEASRVSAVLALGPPTTVALAALAGALWPQRFQPEPLAPASLAGAALVVAGSLAASLGGRRAAATTRAPEA